MSVIHQNRVKRRKKEVNYLEMNIGQCRQHHPKPCPKKTGDMKIGHILEQAISMGPQLRARETRPGMLTYFSVRTFLIFKSLFGQKQT